MNKMMYAPIIERETIFRALADITLRLDDIGIDALIIRLIDLVDADHLPLLAQAMSVLGEDGYDLAESDQIRRELIKGAYDLHRYKGTPWAIREVMLRLGFGNITIDEGLKSPTYTQTKVKNIDPSHKWAHYAVTINKPVTVNQAALIRKTLHAFAPARCVLSFLDFTAASIRHNGQIVRDGRYTRGTV